MDNSTSESKWYDKTWLVIILCIFFFPVGLYALWQNGSISKGWKIGVTILIGLIILSQIGKENKGDSKTTETSTAPTEATEQPSTVQTESTEQIADEPQGIGVGQVLKTDYFEITANKVSLEDRVRTGNQFSDLKPEQGNMFLIIDATFKNTDNESRMIMDGSVWINYNGKDYEFDKTETVLAEGWGLLLDQINPLTTKRTKLVYKIPTEIKGEAYWQPGRADKDERIALGNLQ